MNIQKTEIAAAGELVSRFLSQLEATLSGAKDLLAKGAPANRLLQTPQVSSKAIKDALGSEMLRKLEGILAIVE